MASTCVRLKIKLRSGEVKFYDWYSVNIFANDRFLEIVDSTICILLFKAPMESVEYFERIEEDNGK